MAQVVAALYVPITDGLALVAYACTTRLEGAARKYAWAVVLAAAALSGLAQASFLAQPPGLADPDWRLRFGVGYWPAVAVAVAAHLLWLVGRLPVEAATELSPNSFGPIATAPAERPAALVATTPPPVALVPPPVAEPVAEPRRVSAAVATPRSQVSARTPLTVPFRRKEKGRCDCAREACQAGRVVSWDTWRDHHGVPRRSRPAAVGAGSVAQG